MTVIRKEIEINAPVETVWRYLEDHEHLAAWLMRNDFKPEIGRDFHFYQQPSGNWDGILDCKLVELEAPRRIAFTWNANTIGVDTLVSIDLEEVEGRTKLTLIHTNWEGVLGELEQHIASHAEGWSSHLATLEKACDENVRPAPPVDWTQFRLHVAIDVEPKRVLESWTTSAGMESFFVEMMQITAPGATLREAGERACEGDHFVWRWDSGYCITGKYLSVVAGSEAVFTFGESKVRIRVSPYLKGTLLELHQFDIPDTPEDRMHVHANCRGAWVYFLTVLKTLFEHGVDGRDKTRATGASFSTYFDPNSLGRL
jgi:uncharacterized protein YndB with AHSA1/START domain